MRVINREYIKDIIVESLITSIIAVVLYIIFESCANNVIVALFDGTQKRINIDFKIITIATYLVAIASLWIREKREKNLWTSMIIKVVSSAIIYLSILNLFTYPSLITKFILITFVVIISQIIEKITLKYLNTSKKVDEIFKYINIFLVIILLGGK